MEGEFSRVEAASTDMSGRDARCRLCCWECTASDGVNTLSVCTLVPFDLLNKLLKFVVGITAFSHCAGASEVCLFGTPCFVAFNRGLSSSKAWRLLRRGGGTCNGLSTLYRLPLWRLTAATVAVCRNCSQAAGSYTGIGLRVCQLCILAS